MRASWNVETHCDVIGPSQVGKTSWAIACRREHILDGNHIVSLAWKSDAYEADVAFTAVARPDFPVVLLNPSQCDPVVPYNPFRLPKGRNLSAHVSHLSQVILSTVSHQAIAELQNYTILAEAFFAYLALSGEPVCSAAQYFEPSRAKSWLKLAENVPEQYARTLRNIAQTTAKNWDYKVGALERRLRPFSTSDALRRFTSSATSVSIRDLFDSRTSLFVNAAPSAILSVEAAQIFLGLVLSDILLVGIENATNRRSTYLWADEIQEYAPDNFGSLLDLVLGAGIKVTAIHHFGKNQVSDRILGSLENNARVKVIFGSLPPEVRKRYAEIAFARELNEDIRKQPRISYVPYYEEEYLESETVRDDGYTSVTTSPHFVPRHEETVTGYDFYTPEEKIAKYAARFLVPDREYHVILPDRTKHCKVPRLRTYLYNSPDVLEFIKRQPRITDEPPSETHHRNGITPKKPPHS